MREPKPARIMVGILIGVSLSGRLYAQRATQYAIDSGRINNRKGAPMGYVGAWRLTKLKP